VISTLIGLARTAAVNEQDLVLALDMGWVPGYEQRTLIHTALNPTVKLIESLGAILRSKGVDNVKIVPKGKDEDIDSWRSRIDQLITVPNDFSNVVFLGGEETIALLEDSYSKDLVPDKKAFFAAVDPSRIKAHYDVHLEDRDWQLDLDIIKMISVALELASGINVPAASMIEKYEPQNKKVVFLPLPPEEKQDYDSLLMKYSARRAALAAA
jgi:hypothetical protein